MKKLLYLIFLFPLFSFGQSTVLTNSNHVTVTNKTMDYNNNTFTNFPGSSITTTHSFFADTIKSSGTVISIVPRYNEFDDFLGSNNYLAGSAFFAEIVSGTGADASKMLLPPPTGGTGFGYADIQTGTTTGGNAALSTEGITNRNQLGTVDTNYYVREGFYGVNVDSLSDVTNTYKLYIGNGQPNLSTNNMVFFYYTNADSSGNWVCYCKRGASTTTVNSGVAVVRATSYDLEFEQYNARVKFYINGNLVADISTNVPAQGDVQYAPMMFIIKSAGTISRHLYIDSFKMRIENENYLQN